MGTTGVIPKEPIDESLVEGSKIIPQQGSMAHNAVLGDRPVEPFDECVLLGRADVGIEVGEAEEDAGLLEEEGKLTPVVGLELLDRKRADGDHFLEEVCSRSRGVAGIGTME